MYHIVALLVIAGLAALALVVRRTAFAGFAFTLWVAAFVAAAMFYPLAFRTWFGYPLGGLIVPLIQIIMFGMGTQLTVGDFQRVLAVPRPILIGIVLQFMIMPAVGALVAATLTTDPEVAAGMILIGASPGGVASNVMTYLAGGSVALSVTMTACSTLMAPVMTPLAMQLLAGAYVEVPFVGMMISILQMIIVPIAAGLVVNWLLTRAATSMPAALSLSAAIMRVLPVVSMVAICFIIAIITAISRDQLLAGRFVVAIIAAAAIHNGLGYLFGYWGARALRLSEVEARTVAIEVGLQNAGMASGLAISVLKSPMAAIPPAVFGPWMNMTGAMLASWWANRPVGGVDAPRVAGMPSPATDPATRYAARPAADSTGPGGPGRPRG